MWRAKTPQNINRASPFYTGRLFISEVKPRAFKPTFQVTVILYHPNTRSVYNRYTVPPRQNQFLGNNIIVGDDWGVCFEIKGVPGLVNNVGTISDYNPNYQGSPLFMIQNSRINREIGGQVCGGFAGSVGWSRRG